MEQPMSKRDRKRRPPRAGAGTAASAPLQLRLVRSLSDTAAILASGDFAPMPAAAIAEIAEAACETSLPMLRAAAAAIDLLPPVSGRAEALRELAGVSPPPEPDASLSHAFLMGEAAVESSVTVDPLGYLQENLPPDRSGMGQALALLAVVRHGDRSLLATAAVHDRLLRVAVASDVGCLLMAPLAVTLAASEPALCADLIGLCRTPPPMPIQLWDDLVDVSHFGAIRDEVDDSSDRARAARSEADGQAGDTLEAGSLDGSEQLDLDVLDALGAAYARWFAWLDDIGRGSLLKPGTHKETWRARDLAALARLVVGDAAQRHLHRREFPRALSTVAFAPPGPFGRPEMVKGLAELGIDDLGSMFLPISWGGRERLAERLATLPPELIRKTSIDEFEADPWLARQAGVLLTYVGVAAREAGAVVRGSHISVRSGSIHPDVAYARALAAATFDDSPLLAGNEHQAEPERLLARVGLFHALLYDCHARDDELLTVATGLGVSATAVHRAVQLIAYTVGDPHTPGLGQDIVDLADGARLVTAENDKPTAALAMGISAVLEPALLDLAQVVDDEWELSDPATYEVLDAGQGPGRLPVPTMDDDLLDKDLPSSSLLVGLLAGRLSRGMVEDLAVSLQQEPEIEDDDIDDEAVALSARVQEAAAPTSVSPASDDEPAPVATASVSVSVSTELPSAAVRSQRSGVTAERSMLERVLEAIGTEPTADLLTSQLHQLVGESVGDHLSNRLAAAMEHADSATLSVWADALAPSGAAAGLWSGRARRDLHRAGALERIGRKDEADALLRVLYWRAANGGGAVEGVRQDEIATRLALVEPAGAGEPTAEGLRPARLIFVGGNESQERYVPEIERSLADRYGASVEVEWIHPNWDSNWALYADRVETRLPDCDAVIVMRFVRTNLGRRLRSLASAAGVPWIACTGHGRASMLAAIDEAIAVTQKLAA
jgi:hypothetical protein